MHGVTVARRGKVQRLLQAVVHTVSVQCLGCTRLNAALQMVCACATVAATDFISRMLTFPKVYEYTTILLTTTHLVRLQVVQVHRWVDALHLQPRDVPLADDVLHRARMRIDDYFLRLNVSNAFPSAKTSVGSTVACPTLQC